MGIVLCNSKWIFLYQLPPESSYVYKLIVFLFSSKLKCMLHEILNNKVVFNLVIQTLKFTSVSIFRQKIDRYFIIGVTGLLISISSFSCKCLGTGFLCL